MGDEEIWQAELDPAGTGEDALKMAYPELDEAGARRLALRAVDAVEQAPHQGESAIGDTHAGRLLRPGGYRGHAHGRLLDVRVTSRAELNRRVLAFCAGCRRLRRQ